MTGADTAIPDRGWVGRGQYLRLDWLGEVGLTLGLHWGLGLLAQSPQGYMGAWVVVSMKLLKHQRSLLPSCAMRKTLIYRWAPESHGHLGRQIAAAGSQGSGSPLFINQFPWLLWGLSARPLPLCVPTGRQSICWISAELSALRCFSTSVPSSPPASPSCAHMWTQAQDSVYFEDIWLDLCSGKGSLPTLGLSLGTSSPSRASLVPRSLHFGRLCN